MSTIAARSAAPPPISNVPRRVESRFSANSMVDPPYCVSTGMHGENVLKWPCEVSGLNRHAICRRGHDRARLSRVQLVRRPAAVLDLFARVHSNVAVECAAVAGGSARKPKHGRRLAPGCRIREIPLKPKS